MNTLNVDFSNDGAKLFTSHFDFASKLLASSTYEKKGKEQIEEGRKEEGSFRRQAL